MGTAKFCIDSLGMVLKGVYVMRQKYACFLLLVISLAIVPPGIVRSQDNWEGSKEFPLLPQDRKAIVKLSIGELTMAFRRAESSLRTECNVGEAPVAEDAAEKQFLQDLERQVNEAADAMHDTYGKIVQLRREVSGLIAYASSVGQAGSASTAALQELAEFHPFRSDKTGGSSYHGSHVSTQELKNLGDLKSQLNEIRSGVQGAKGEERNRLLTALPTQLRTLMLQMRVHADKLLTKLLERDKQGLSWLHRAIMTSNWGFVYWIDDFTTGNKTVMGTRIEDGTLSKELNWAVSRSNYDRVKQLLYLGADVYQAPPEYSALAISKIFGDSRISSLLKRHASVLQVPWNPVLYDSPAQTLNALEDQVNRVERLATEMGTSHDKDMVNWLRKRLDCLKSKSPGQPGA